MPGSSNPYAIGSTVWPGLSKLIEEMGEVAQIVGKLLAYPEGEHPDGKGDLRERLREELADLKAAIEFVEALNSLRDEERVKAKCELFARWHFAERQAASSE